MLQNNNLSYTFKRDDINKSCILLTDILNHNFLTWAKAEIKDLTVCIVVNGEKLDLDLDRTMPNVELVRAIFIYYNMFKFQVD